MDLSRVKPSPNLEDRSGQQNTLVPDQANLTGLSNIYMNKLTPEEQRLMDNHDFSVQDIMLMRAFKAEPNDILRGARATLTGNRKYE